MTKEQLQKPEILAVLGGALLVILGGLTKWVIVPSTSLLNLVSTKKEELESLIHTKSVLSIVIALITVGLVMWGVIKKKKGFLIAGLVFSILTLIPIGTAYLPSSNSSVKLLDIDGMEKGYYLSVLGGIILLIGSARNLMLTEKQS